MQIDHRIEMRTVVQFFFLYMDEKSSVRTLPALRHEFDVGSTVALPAMQGFAIPRLRGRRLLPAGCLFCRAVSVSSQARLNASTHTSGLRAQLPVPLIFSQRER